MAVSALQKENDELFFKVRLVIQFRDLVLAGIPKAGNPLDYFMSARHMSDEEKADFKKRIQDGQLSEDEKNQIKEMNWCTFERDHAQNLCMWHGNLKAMMREIFTTFGLTQRRPNTKKPGAKGKKGTTDETPLIAEKDPSAGGRQTFQHGVHVDPIRIPFERRDADGKVHYIKVAEVDTEVVNAPTDDHYVEALEFVDKVKHIKDMNGTRSALGRHDKLLGVCMTIYLKWPARGVFDNNDMRKAWAACQDDGLGACRSQGFGKFDVIEWEVINDPTKK